MWWGRVSLGLTVNCARCHAHKFDPIPQEDYYRLKAVFDGVKHGERTIATPQETQQRESTLASLKSEIERAEKVVRDGNRLGGNAKPGANHPSQPTPLSWRPLLQWSFSQPTEVARAGSLEGGATISEGCLVLPQSGAYFRLGPIPRDLKEKTLEAGFPCRISVREAERPSRSRPPAVGTGCDRLWGTAGSKVDGWKRRVFGLGTFDAPDEDAVPGSSVHMAVVYSADNKVTMYRNGVPYGKPYTAAAPCCRRIDPARPACCWACVIPAGACLSFDRTDFTRCSS